MKYLLYLIAVAALLGLATAGYVSHGWSYPVVYRVRKVYVPVSYGWKGGYGGWSGGYGGWRGGYGGWW
ncbi:hypothetical protein evm_011561 [Chilo suppressalis]|nr:hypothetical protein evm_011561 [Chilo suppressalis]